MQRRIDPVCLSSHPVDGDLDDGRSSHILILKRSGGMALRDKLLDHLFKDSPLFSKVLHKPGPSETGHAFVNLADPAAPFPEDLGSDVSNVRPA